jgi:hypothetical protein
MAQRAPSPGADPIDVLVAFLMKEKLLELPAATLTAKQVATPDGANGSTTIASRPSFPELIGLAFDNNMAGLKDGVFTVDLNLFAFRQLADPRVAVDQTRYGTPGNSRMRRVGVAISVGGKGEKVDRDGDGKPEDAAIANALTDVVSGEFRWRLVGSRDRRDEGNFRQFTSDIGPEYERLVTATRDYFVRHADTIPLITAANGDRNLDVDAFKKQLASGDRAELKALADAYQQFIARHEALVATIDQQAVWTLVVGGTHHGASFGPNRWKVGLRGAKAGLGWDHTFNLGWKRADAYLDRPVAETWSMSYEASHVVWKGSTFGDGATLSMAANLERNRHVLEAKHNTIARASVALALPVSTKVTLPITLTYANHSDLLTGRTFAGQISLAWDLSGEAKK